MSGLELNKIAASILIAALIAMLVGTIANVLYQPNLTLKQRGYIIKTHGVKEESTDETEQAEELLDIASLMDNANAEAGSKIIKKCIACHTFNEGGNNKVGPNLWNIINTAKANSNDYNYSSSLQKAGGTWTYEDLFAYLNNPRKFLPENKMSFAGLKNPEDIANLLEYLRQTFHDPKPEIGK